MRWVEYKKGELDLGDDVAWVLAYTTVDVDLEEALTDLAANYPAATVFGTTSFQGVFTPAGFR